MKFIDNFAVQLNIETYVQLQISSKFSEGVPFHVQEKHGYNLSAPGSLIDISTTPFGFARYDRLFSQPYCRSGDKLAGMGME